MKNFLNYILLVSSFQKNHPFVIERQKEIRKYYNDPDNKIEFLAAGNWYTLPHDELALETLLNYCFLYTIRVTFWNECQITFNKIKFK